MKTVIVSGYFLVYHAGHEEYLRKAKELAGMDGQLFLILNNDHQQKLKYKKVIVPINQRKAVMESVKYIDRVIESVDMNHTVCYTLRAISEIINDYLIFAKGGDRHINEIPEKETCERLEIKIVDGLGEKIQSASTLLKI